MTAAGVAHHDYMKGFHADAVAAARAHRVRFAELCAAGVRPDSHPRRRESCSSVPDADGVACLLTAGGGCADVDTVRGIRTADGYSGPATRPEPAPRVPRAALLSLRVPLALCPLVPPACSARYVRLSAVAGRSRRSRPTAGLGRTVAGTARGAAATATQTEASMLDRGWTGACTVRGGTRSPTASCTKGGTATGKSTGQASMFTQTAGGTKVHPSFPPPRESD